MDELEPQEPQIESLDDDDDDAGEFEPITDEPVSATRISPYAISAFVLGVLTSLSW